MRRVSLKRAGTPGRRRDTYSLGPVLHQVDHLGAITVSDAGCSQDAVTETLYLQCKKLAWRKFRRRISEFCYVGGIFTGHNTARSASLNSASVGRLKMLQRRKISRDLA